MHITLVVAQSGTISTPDASGIVYSVGLAAAGTANATLSVTANGGTVCRLAALAGTSAERRFTAAGVIARQPLAVVLAGDGATADLELMW